MHRGRKFLKEERRMEKAKKKVNWYRKGKGNGKEINHAPLIINPTYDSKLVEIMRKICEETARTTGIRIKVMERGGQKIRHDAKSDPKATKECKRELCLICRGERGGRCSDYGIVYRVTCITCKEQGGERGGGRKKVVYIGETGKNGYLRGIEHERAAEILQENNAIGKHCIMEHRIIKPELKMEVLKKYRTCLERQEGEAVYVRLESNEETEIMNSRSDFHQPPLVRVITTRGNSQEEQGQQPNQAQVEGGQRGRPGRGRGGVRGRPRGGRGVRRGNREE
jgi:hypothetical protein